MTDAALEIILRGVALTLLIGIVIICAAMTIEGRRNRRRTKRDDTWFT